MNSPTTSGSPMLSNTSVGLFETAQFAGILCTSYLRSSPFSLILRILQAIDCRDYDTLHILKLKGTSVTLYSNFLLDWSPYWRRKQTTHLYLTWIPSSMRFLCKQLLYNCARTLVWNLNANECRGRQRDNVLYFRAWVYCWANVCHFLFRTVEHP